MANAPTKTKLHDRLEAIILNARNLINEKVESGEITKAKAEQLRSEMQKQVEASLSVLDLQVTEVIWFQVPVEPKRDIANELAAENAALAASEN